MKISAGAAESLNGFRETESSLVDLSDFVSDFCSQLDYPAVLIIDEVDQASDQLMDEYLPGREENGSGTFWTENGVAMAVKELLAQSNPLFDDIVKKLDDFPELRKTLYAILFKGERIPYNSYHQALNVGSMFGIIKNDRGNVSVSNRIFETLIYNLWTTVFPAVFETDHQRNRKLLC